MLLCDLHVHLAYIFSIDCWKTSLFRFLSHHFFLPSSRYTCWELIFDSFYMMNIYTIFPFNCLSILVFLCVNYITWWLLTPRNTTQIKECLLWEWSFLCPDVCLEKWNRTGRLLKVLHHMLCMQGRREGGRVISAEYACNHEPELLKVAWLFSFIHFSKCV